MNYHRHNSLLLQSPITSSFHAHSCSTPRQTFHCRKNVNILHYGTILRWYNRFSSNLADIRRGAELDNRTCFTVPCQHLTAPRSCSFFQATGASWVIEPLLRLDIAVTLEGDMLVKAKQRASASCKLVDASSGRREQETHFQWSCRVVISEPTFKFPLVLTG